MPTTPAPAPNAARRARRDITLLSLGIGLLFIPVGGAQQYLVPWFTSRKLLDWAHPILASLYVSIFLGSFLTNHVIARLGLVRSLAAAKCVYVAFLFCLAMGSPWVAWCAGVACGLAASVLWTAERALLTKLPAEADREASAARFYFLYYLGTSLGCVLLGVLIPRAGYSGPLLWVAVASVVALAPLARLSPEALAVEPPPPAQDRWPAFTKTLLQAALATFASRLVYGMAISRVPEAVDGLWDATWVGMVSAIYFSISAVVALLAGPLIVRRSIGQVGLLAQGLSVSGLCVLALKEQSVWLLVGFALAAIGASLFNPVETVITGRLSTPENRVRISSLFTLASSLGTSAAVLAGPALKHGWYYLAIAAITLVGAVTTRQLMTTPEEELRAQVARELARD